MRKLIREADEGRERRQPDRVRAPGRPHRRRGDGRHAPGGHERPEHPELRRPRTWPGSRARRWSRGRRAPPATAPPAWGKAMTANFTHPGPARSPARGCRRRRRRRRGGFPNAARRSPSPRGASPRSGWPEGRPPRASRRWWRSGVLALLLLPWMSGKLGGGDVKLIAATAIWIGPSLVLPFLAFTAVAGAPVALATRLVQFVRLRREAPGATPHGCHPARLLRCRRRCRWQPPSRSAPSRRSIGAGHERSLPTQASARRRPHRVRHRPPRVPVAPARRHRLGLVLRAPGDGRERHAGRGAGRLGGPGRHGRGTTPRSPCRPT